MRLSKVPSLRPVAGSPPAHSFFIGHVKGIHRESPRCAPGTLLIQCRLHKTKKHGHGPMMMIVIVLFIVLARNKLRIPLEGTYSREM